MAESGRIDIDMNTRCKRCRKPGATQSGLCLGCVTKWIKEHPAEIRALAAKLPKEEPS